MNIFKYGRTEIDYLKKKDKRLAEAIERIGLIERQVTPDLFTALIGNIVGQQISNKAAATVRKRLLDLIGEITPEKIANTDIHEIQQCGMSVKKASYIKNIGEAVFQKKVDIAQFPELSDGEIIKQLSALNGVGVWTAEMLLIFSMERPNVLSWGDLAIRRGMMLLYKHKELDKIKFERYRKRYSPYCSVASLYLWEISAGR